uniref:Secreted protein n=1 Tax=Steinernema glaseri TaxID=37863 RepID=A0A1I7ZRL7_9BILA
MNSLCVLLLLAAAALVFAWPTRSQLPDLSGIKAWDRKVLSTVNEDRLLKDFVETEFSVVNGVIDVIIGLGKVAVSILLMIFGW